MDNDFKKCNHTKPNMGYLQWFEYAQSLHEKGEKQTRCKCCGKFVWDSEWNNRFTHQ